MPSIWVVRSCLAQILDSSFSMSEMLRARAWAYPGQENGWTMVSPGKLGAWYLLMYISFVLVASLHRARSSQGKDNSA